MRLPGALLTLLLAVFATGAAWAQDAGKKSIYLVDNMTCGACIATISKAVGAVDAGAVVSGDPARGVVVVYHGEDTGAEAIGASMTESGYPARVMASVEAGPGDAASMAGARARTTGASCCFAAERPACGGGMAESWKAMFEKMKARFGSGPEEGVNK